MDSRPIPKLASVLANTLAGKPALVIGGGPSVATDLPRIPGWQEMYQISANDHGFRVEGARPQLIVCKDHSMKIPLARRNREPKRYMEPILREYGVPIASRQHWADYRMAAWRANGGNSGMLAISVAVMMGAAPVIVVGIDCYQGATYFHAAAEDNVSLGRPLSYWERRLTSFRDKLKGSYVRALSGPVARTFGTYHPGEQASYHMPDVFKRYRLMETHVGLVRRSFQDPMDREATVEKGRLVALTADEFQKYQRLGLVDAAPPPAVSSAGLS